MAVMSGGTLVPVGGALPGHVDLSAGHSSALGADLFHQWAAYGVLYRTQPMVYTLVSKLARLTARIPLQTFHRGDGNRTDARDSAYGKVLRRPNPVMGPERLWLWTASTFELYGEAIWLKARDASGQVVALWPMHPTSTSTRREWNERTKQWELKYLLLGGRLVVDRTDVVHFASYNPDSLVRGLSPCEPLRRTLELEDRAARANTAMWKHGARPSVVLTHPKHLSDTAHKRVRGLWDQTYSGVDNWGKAAILEEGLKVELVQLNAEEMQYIEGRRLGREECCGAWDVPPPAVHILDHATFSNITEQLRSLYRDTMPPRFSAYEDTLAVQLAPDFAMVDGLDVYAEFNVDAVLRGDIESRIAANAQAIGTGQSTINESRRRENLPDVEGGDELLVNAALVPLSAAIAPPPVFQRVGLPALVDGGLVSEAEAAALLGTSTSGLSSTPERHEDEPAASKTVATIGTPTRTVKGLSAADARLITGRLRRAGEWDQVDDTKLLAGVTGHTSTTIRGLLIAGRSRGTDLATVQRQILAQVAAPLDLPDLTPPLVEA